MIRHLFFLLSFLFSTVLAGKAQEKKISLFEEKRPLKEIIREIEKQTDFSFAYGEDINLETIKSISVSYTELGKVLNIVFSGTGIDYKIIGKQIILNRVPKKIRLSGYVLDKATGETLIGASVVGIPGHRGTVSNNYGYFTISLPEGVHQIQLSYVGYQPVQVSLPLRRDTLVHWYLEQNAWLEEVVISDRLNKPFSPASGIIELSMNDIKYTPSVFGETDVLKVLQLLPGVQSGAEGSAGIYVRGGGPDQNLTLLDGVNVYNTNHFYGLFSVFNGDAVKKVTLYKGSFPARFGGRLSSVIDVRLKDGNMQEYHGNFSIGLLSSRFNLEGPIVKDRTSFHISARRSYVDLFLRAAGAISDEWIPYLYFYDLNAKINHKFNDKSRLYLSFYNGKDKLGSTREEKENTYEKDKLDYKWSNLVGSARWNYVFNNRLFANTTLAYNRYRFDFMTSNEDRSLSVEPGPGLYQYKYTNYQHSGIEDWSLNTDFEYQPDNKHKIRFGGGYIFHTFKPEVKGARQYESRDREIIKNQDLKYLSDDIPAHEMTAYIEDEFPLTPKLSVNAGFQLSGFHVEKKSYISLQPRLSVGYEFNRNLSLKSSYSLMTQYIHLLSSSALVMPTDLWVPVTADISPMRSDQFTLGAFYDTRTGYYFSVEGFYKKMNNLLEYKDGASWKMSSASWETQVESGEGRVYGLELFARKTSNKLSGWIGYTLSWNDRKFKEINRGERFPAKYDRRHDMNINLSYKFNERWDFSAAFSLASGSNYTLPLEIYPTYPINNLNIGESAYGWSNNPEWIKHPESRNNFRMPLAHHLDLSMNYYRKKSPKGRQASWNFSIYNVYNSVLPMVVYPSYNYRKQRMVVEQYSLFPILPSITYTYKF